MREHFAVASGSEAMSPDGELAPQVVVVVDLAVEDDHYPAILAVERLAAVFDVHDRESAHAERDVAPDVKPVAVRSSVDHRLSHRADRPLIRRAAGVENAGDPAHQPTTASVATRSPRFSRSSI